MMEAHLLKAQSHFLWSRRSNLLKVIKNVWSFSYQFCYIRKIKSDDLQERHFRLAEKDITYFGFSNEIFLWPMVYPFISAFSIQRLLGCSLPVLTISHGACRVLWRKRKTQTLISFYRLFDSKQWNLSRVHFRKAS